MDNSGFFAFLVVVALVVFVILALKNSRLQAELNERAEHRFQLWRQRELEAARAQLWGVAQDHARADLERWKIEAEAEIREDAVRRSQAVISGKVTEHLAPFMVSFPYNPKDVRFLGSPVDLIVFDGMDEGDLREIVFVEVKFGSSDLSTRERRLRDVVSRRKITWKEFRPAGGERD